MEKTTQDNMQTVNEELIKEQEEIRRKNKKEDKVAILPFFLILLVSTAVGAFFGFSSVAAKEAGMEAALAAVRRALVVSAPYVLALCIIVTIFLGYVYFIRRSREYRQGAKALPEEKLAALQDDIEYRLNLPLAITSVVTLIGFFEMSVVLIYMEKIDLLRIVVTIAEFAVSMALSVILQQKLINFEKEMNPEKRGSVFSVDFQKTWVNSCDEAEKSMIYEATYFSYMVSNTVSVFLWVILSFAGFALNLGILPAAVVVFLWGVQMFSYSYKAIRLEKERCTGVKSR